jgi:hypothetical protein
MKEAREQGVDVSSPFPSISFAPFNACLQGQS